MLSIGNKSKYQYLYWKLCSQKHTFLGTIYLCLDVGVVIKGWFCHINTLLFLPWVSERLDPEPSGRIVCAFYLLSFFSRFAHIALWKPHVGYWFWWHRRIQVVWLTKRFNSKRTTTLFDLQKAIKSWSDKTTTVNYHKISQ